MTTGRRSLSIQLLSQKVATASAHAQPGSIVTTLETHVGKDAAVVEVAATRWHTGPTCSEFGVIGPACYLLIAEVLASAVTSPVILTHAPWKHALPLVTGLLVVHETQCGIREIKIARTHQAGTAYTASMRLLTGPAIPNVVKGNMLHLRAL